MDDCRRGLKAEGRETAKEEHPVLFSTKAAVSFISSFISACNILWQSCRTQRCWNKLTGERW